MPTSARPARAPRVAARAMRAPRAPRPPPPDSPRTRGTTREPWSTRRPARHRSSSAATTSTRPAAGTAAVGGLPSEAELLEEHLIGRELGVGRREQLVAVEDRVGARHEHHRLLRLGEREPTRREADHRARQHDARGRDHAPHVPDGRRLHAAERRAVDRDERVDGHRLGVFGQRREGVQQRDAIGVFLAQSEDPAAAHADARVAHVGDGLQPVLVGSRRDDLRVVLAARVEVVIVRREARLLELARLLRVDHAERAADLKPERVDRADALEDRPKRALLVAQPRATRPPCRSACCPRPWRAAPRRRSRRASSSASA